MKLSIIIPVYNEQQTVGEVIDRVCAVGLDNMEKEIIVADMRLNAVLTFSVPEIF